MVILTIDTSERRGSVAVLRGGDKLALATHSDTSDYSEWLIPAVEGTLAEAEVDMPSVDLYAVATGPGSFTAVRVGLATVKAWCEVYGKPVVGVSRLEALAHSASRNDRPLAAYYDAQRGQIFAGLYRCMDGELSRIGDELVIAPNEFLELVEDRAEQVAVHWVTLDPQLVTNLDGWQHRTANGDRMEQVSAELAPAIGRIAERRARVGGFTNRLELDANYVRRSDAEIFWKGPAAHGR